MKNEFYKMEYEAWDEGTERLTLEEEAAYLRFCHQMYRRKGPVDNHLPSLARLWRCHQNKARKILTSLLDTGKIELTHTGHLTNTRVTHELDVRETRSRQRSDAGHTGGTRSGDSRRKSLTSNADNEALASIEDKQNEAEKRREEERRVDTSDPKGSGAAAPSDAVKEVDEDDPKTILFRRGLKSLVEQTGMSTNQARAVLGKWLNGMDENALAVLRAIDASAAQRPADPMAWMQGALRTAKKAMGGGGSPYDRPKNQFGGSMAI